jgi:hypothetical protein
VKCPRRHEVHSSFWTNDEDKFVPGHGLVGQPTGCDFCGSMNPQMVLFWMASGCEITPTDKSYKLYLRLYDLDGKFYFQHFSTQQVDRFIELYNEKPRKFTIAYPGYFYVLPYFCARGGE